MGEAKRRQQYWAKQGQTPPPQAAQHEKKSGVRAIKEKIHQIKADTKRVKQDAEFKRQCQQKFAAKNRSIKKRLEQRDFRDASDIIAKMQTKSAQLSSEQVELWIDYLISGLLDTKNIEPVQAELFVWELETYLQPDAEKTQQEYQQLFKQIAATKAYLKSLEVWVDIDNDLLTIYQVRSSFS